MAYKSEDTAEAVEKHLSHAKAAAAQLVRERNEAADVIEALAAAVEELGSDLDVHDVKRFAACLRGDDDGDPFSSESALEAISRAVPASSVE